MSKISQKKLISHIFKPIVFLILLLPFVWLAWNWHLIVGERPNGLTANPIEFTNRFLGEWGLNFILLGLLITPLSRLANFPKFMLFRRMVGLFAFFYLMLHFASYTVLDHFFNWSEIWQDIVKRNFITIGMLALLALVPMALTSTNAMIKKIGAKKWSRLHMLIYPIAILGVFHFDMMRKGDQLEPKIYWAILFLLLGYRALVVLRRRLRKKVGS